MPDTGRRERAAVARWRPRQRWYHPAIAPIVVGTSRFVMTRMNRLEVQCRERFDGALQREGRGLLMVSNHVSLFDDPLLISNLVQGPYRNYRWVSADALNFFGRPSTKCYPDFCPASQLARTTSAAAATLTQAAPRR